MMIGEPRRDDCRTETQRVPIAPSRRQTGTCTPPNSAHLILLLGLGTASAPLHSEQRFAASFASCEARRQQGDAVAAAAAPGVSQRARQPPLLAGHNVLTAQLRGSQVALCLLRHFHMLPGSVTDDRLGDHPNLPSGLI